jgi:hypothetical protein
LDQSLKKLLYITIPTLALWNWWWCKKTFDLIGQLLKSNKDSCQVQLVPDGIIKYIHYRGNEKAIGLNILESKLLQEEAYAIKMYFAGPLPLVQGRSRSEITYL